MDGVHGADRFALERFDNAPIVVRRVDLGPHLGGDSHGQVLEFSGFGHGASQIRATLPRHRHAPDTVLAPTGTIRFLIH